MSTQQTSKQRDFNTYLQKIGEGSKTEDLEEILSSIVAALDLLDRRLLSAEETTQRADVADRLESLEDRLEVVGRNAEKWRSHLQESVDKLENQLSALRDASNGQGRGLASRINNLEERLDRAGEVMRSDIEDLQERMCQLEQGPFLDGDTTWAETIENDIRSAHGKIEKLEELVDAQGSTLSTIHGKVDSLRELLNQGEEVVLEIPDPDLSHMEVGELVREEFEEVSVTGYSAAGHPERTIDGTVVTIGNRTFRISSSLDVQQKLEDGRHERTAYATLVSTNLKKAYREQYKEDITTQADKAHLNQTALRHFIRWVFPEAPVTDREQTGMQDGVNVEWRGYEFYVSHDLRVEERRDGMLAANEKAKIMEEALHFAWRQLKQHGGPDPLPGKGEMQYVFGDGDPPANQHDPILEVEDDGEWALRLHTFAGGDHQFVATYNDPDDAAMLMKLANGTSIVTDERPDQASPTSLSNAAIGLYMPPSGDSEYLTDEGVQTIKSIVTRALYYPHTDVR